MWELHSPSLASFKGTEAHRDVLCHTNCTDNRDVVTVAGSSFYPPTHIDKHFLFFSVTSFGCRRSEQYSTGFLMHKISGNILLSGAVSVQ